MYYLGSKRKLIPFVKATIQGVAGTDLSQLTFCDLFAGTAIVGRTFKSSVKTIICNDWEAYAYALNRNYIGNHRELADKQKYINELNQLPLVDNGFIYRHYCKGGGTDRLYFSDENGKRIDTIRQGIETLRNVNQIDDDLYYFLLASLLESADMTANTTGFYHSYLKNLVPTAQMNMRLRAADFEINKNTHQVFNENANTLIKRIAGDILYLDPPYTKRNYGSSYHILNTIALYDNFVPKGITGIRTYQRSNWCSGKKVENELDNLLRHAQFKYIFLSYNDEGILHTDTIKRIMKRYGRYEVASTDYRRFNVGIGVQKRDKTMEYIHILEKD